MADGMICRLETKTREDGLSDSAAPSSNGSPFLRKIEFHLARKSFSGFANSGGDFRLETLNPSSESQKPGCNPGQSSGKKADGSEIFDNGLDLELSSGTTFRRIGAGLENLGNTCFLNSVLQCLTYTEPLVAYLQSGKHQTSCHNSGFCALCAIQKHVSRALQSTGRILAPKDLVSNLRCISRNFRNARQEDAHEYMVNLLESMHKCCLPSGVSSESPSAYEKSLVHNIFGGRLRSQVKCMQCSYCSNKFDPFLDLSLEIAKADSLHKALMHFTATEQLDGGERQYQCQRCKQKVKALKQLTVHKAPYVLTIHLKRFASHDPGQKIDKKVQFGPTLDFKPFVSDSYEGELKYTLYGVLVHAGWSTHSGHYYCFVRTSTGMWYSLDDNRVVQVNERTVLEQKAYMLFYVRDRKNFTSKKPVDVLEESVGSNAMGNKKCSLSKPGLKETVQNGTIERRLNGAATSAALAQRYALNVGSSNETLLKEATLHKINVTAMTDSSTIKTDRAVKSSLKVPLFDPLKGPSVLKPNVGKCFAPPPLHVKVIVETPNPVNAPATTGTKINGCNENGSSNKDLSFSVSIPSTCNGHHGSDNDKLVSEKASRKISIVSSVGELNVASSRSCDVETLEKIDTERSPNLPSSETSQVECITNESAPVDPVSEKTDESVQGLVAIESVELSHPLVTMNESLDVKSRGCVRYKKSKKKLRKCRAASMRLAPKFLFGSSLSLQRKKKHKRSKQRSLGTKDLSKQNLFDGDCVPADLGPSTSEITETISLCSTHSQRKVLKSRSKKGNNGTVAKDWLNTYSDSFVENMDGEFRERIGQTSAMLATDKRPQKSASFSSATNQWDAGEPESLKDSKRVSMQNGLMNMLTRGVEEIVVARWDGTELPPSQILESSAVEATSIGYVLDEWDEEYDRGKRKKVRKSKNRFGGANPFQEIAAEKAQLKKLKMEQSSSGNRPFRI